jgi:uncharacterized surface protein with fasciclin (FAS1) repeats
MNIRINYLFQMAVAGIFLMSCNAPTKTESTNAEAETAMAGAGQSAVVDNESQKNVVQIASGSADHTTLVTAIKTAEYVDVLANTGPFTVFAPTNAAFDKLPKGTVEGLLKPEKKNDLRNILEYHVSVGVYKQESFMDGQSIGQVNGNNVKMRIDGDKMYVNDALIVAAIPASNGIIYVVDGVLLPPAAQ